MQIKMLHHQICQNILIVIVIALIIILFNNFDSDTTIMLQYYLLGMTGIALVMTSNYHNDCAIHGGKFFKMPKILTELKSLSKLSGEKLKHKARELKTKFSKMKDSAFKSKLIQTLDNISSGTLVGAQVIYNIMSEIGNRLVRSPQLIGTLIAMFG